MKPTARWLRINPLNSDESCWEARTTRPNCKVSKLLTNIFLWNFSTGTMPGIWAGSQKNEDFFFWKNYLTNFKDEGLIDLLFRIFRKTGTVSRNYINLKCQSWTKKNLLIFLRTRIHGVGPTDWYQSERNIWKNIWKKYLEKIFSEHFTYSSSPLHGIASNPSFYNSYIEGTTLSYIHQQIFFWQNPKIIPRTLRSRVGTPSLSKRIAINIWKK